MNGRTSSECGAPTREDVPIPHSLPRQSRSLTPATGGAVLVTLLAAAVVIPYFVLGYAPAERQRATTELAAELGSQAKQRETVLAAWVEDGFEDARTVASYPSVRGVLAERAGSARRSATEAAHVRNLLRTFALTQRYLRVVLVDAGLGVVAPGPEAPLAPGAVRLLRASLTGGTDQVGFFRQRHEADRPAVGWVSPVKDGAGHLLGAILVEADPAMLIYPVLGPHPLPQASSEALLIELRGDTAVWASPLAKSRERPLERRRVLAAADRPAAWQGLHVGSGVDEYVDYAGTPVFGTTRPVPGAPWVVAVKVDRDEVLAPVRAAQRREALDLALVLAALGVIALVAWWNARRAVQIETARGRLRLAAALDQANDAILIVSPDGVIRDCNRRAEEFYGVRPGGLIGREVASLRVGEGREESAAALAALRTEGQLVWEALHLAAGGRIVPVEVASRRFSSDGGEEIISVVRDITERKAAERRIHRLNRMLRTRSRIERLMVRGPEPLQLLQQACRILVEATEFRLAAAGVAEPDGSVRYVASAGETAYLAEVRVRWDASPEGLGPTGTALRVGRVIVIEDVATDARFAPWRDAAQRFGLRSSAAAPIPGNTEAPAGILSIHAAETGVFDAAMVELLEELASELGFALRAFAQHRALRSAESGLHLTLERLAAVVQACPVPLVVQERDFTVSGWNPAAERVFGWKAAEVLGGPPPFIPPERREEARRAFAELLAGRSLAGLERRRLRRDGAQVDVVLSAAPIRAGDGTVAGVVALFNDVTEIRRTAEALRASEAKLRSFFESGLLGVLFGDVHGHVFDGNEELCRIIGRSREEILAGRVAWDAVTPPEFLPRDEAAIAEARARGSCTPYEKAYVRPDGTRVPILVGFVLLEPDRERSVAFVLDITERQRASAALEERERELREAQRIGRVGSFVGDQVTGRWTGTPELDEILGIDAAWERTSAHFETLVHPDDRPGFAAHYREVLATGRDFELDYRIVRPADGAVRWVAGCGVLTRDAYGAPATMTGTIQDITERREAEERVRALNVRLEVLIVAVQALAAARSIEEVAAIVRAHARRLLGADGATFALREDGQCHYVDEDAIAPLWKGQRFPLEACASGWAMLNHRPAVVPDVYADPRTPVEAYRATFVKSLAIVPIRSELPLGAIGAYWAAPHTADDLEVRLLQTLADATARALENVELLETLEERVRVRTTELEAANRELEAFAYSVSHDLRAPLRAIDGFGRILEEEGARLDDEGRRLLGVIRHGTRQMGQLIDDLLAFSRAGRTELVRARVDMTALARQAWESLAGLEDRAAVTFRLDPLPEAEADPALLRQVWVNLLANALKFTRGRPVRTVTVGAGVEEGRAFYYVRDDGVGFDPRFKDKLFGVFQRLHPASEFEGTGVGLALTQRIVHRHGGAVWAEGVPGAGASFYFTVPRGSDG